MAKSNSEAIGILFGVLGGGDISKGSGKQIKEELSEIVKQINEDESLLKLKVRIDESFNAQAEKMAASLQKIADKADVSGAVSNSTKALKETQAAVEGVAKTQKTAQVAVENTSKAQKKAQTAAENTAKAQEKVKTTAENAAKAQETAQEKAQAAAKKAVKSEKELALLHEKRSKLEKGSAGKSSATVDSYKKANAAAKEYISKLKKVSSYKQASHKVGQTGANGEFVALGDFKPSTVNAAKLNELRNSLISAYNELKPIVGDDAAKKWLDEIGKKVSDIRSKIEIVAPTAENVAKVQEKVKAAAENTVKAQEEAQTATEKTVKSEKELTTLREKRAQPKKESAIEKAAESSAEQLQKATDVSKEEQAVAKEATETKIEQAKKVVEAVQAETEAKKQNIEAQKETASVEKSTEAQAEQTETVVEALKEKKKAVENVANAQTKVAQIEDAQESSVALTQEESKNLKVAALDRYDAYDMLSHAIERYAEAVKKAAVASNKFRTIQFAGQRRRIRGIAIDENQKLYKSAGSYVEIPENLGKISRLLEATQKKQVNKAYWKDSYKSSHLDAAFKELERTQNVLRDIFKNDKLTSLVGEETLAKLLKRKAEVENEATETARKYFKSTSSQAEQQLEPSVQAYKKAKEAGDEYVAAFKNLVRLQDSLSPELQKSMAQTVGGFRESFLNALDDPALNETAKKNLTSSYNEQIDTLKIELKGYFSEVEESAEYKAELFKTIIERIKEYVHVISQLDSVLSKSSDYNASENTKISAHTGEWYTYSNDPNVGTWVRDVNHAKEALDKLLSAQNEFLLKGEGWDKISDYIKKLNVQLFGSEEGLEGILADISNLKSETKEFDERTNKDKGEHFKAARLRGQSYEIYDQGMYGSFVDSSPLSEGAIGYAIRRATEKYRADYQYLSGKLANGSVKNSKKELSERMNELKIQMQDLYDRLIDEGYSMLASDYYDAINNLDKEQNLILSKKASNTELKSKIETIIPPAEEGQDVAKKAAETQAAQIQDAAEVLEKTQNLAKEASDTQAEQTQKTVEAVKVEAEKVLAEGKRDLSASKEELATLREELAREEAADEKDTGLVDNYKEINALAQEYINKLAKINSYKQASRKVGQTSIDSEFIPLGNYKWGAQNAAQLNELRNLLEIAYRELQAKVGDDAAAKWFENIRKKISEIRTEIEIITPAVEAETAAETEAEAAAAASTEEQQDKSKNAELSYSRRLAIIKEYYSLLNQIIHLQSKGEDLSGNEQDGFKSKSGQNSNLVNRYKKISESYRSCRSEMEYFKENIDECSMSEQKLLQLFAQDEALRAALDISTQNYAANGKSAWANLTQKARQYVDKVYDAASRNIDVKKALDEIRKMANGESEDAYTQYDALKAALASVQRTIGEGGLSDPTWWQRMKRTFGSRVRSLFAGFGAGNISKYLQDVYNNVKNIDSAMTQLKIVTGETDDRFSQYFKNVAASAKKAGASISSLIESATTFARLGYSLSESETFAELAAAYSNVADTDVSSATTSITTIIKAFGVSADELESVLDRLMYVGQKFPISADELGTGFENAGSALKAAGNDINQSMALLTAANTEIQDISKASTALRTIVARINRSETELEDIGESIEDVPTTAKLQEEMMAYGVSIEDSNGNLRNTYDILTDLSNVWDELNNSQRSAIAELVAGTRQQSIFFGLMNSFDTEAVGVMNSIGEANGELSRATEVYSDSIEGRLKTVSATFEEFSANFLDSDFVKFIANIVNVAVSGLNVITKGIQKIGGLKTVLLALAATLLVVKGKLIAVKLIAKATDVWTKATKGITNGIEALTSAIPGAIEAWKNYAAGTASANEVMQASIPVIGLVLAAVSLLITGISIYNNVLDENKEKAREASDSATELSDSIYDLTQKYLSLSKAVSEDKEEKEDLLSTQDELLDNLDLEQWKLDELVKKYGSYTDAIKSASVEKLKEKERDIRGGLSVAKDELLDESDGWYDKFGEVSGRAANGESLDKREDAYAALEALKNAGYITAGNYSVYTDQKTGEKYSRGFSLFLNTKYDMTTVSGIVQAYEELGKMIDIVGDTSGEDNFVYKALYNEYSGMTEFVDKYKEEVDDLNNNLTQQYAISGLIGQEIPKTQEEFDSYRKEVVEAAVASGEFVGTQVDIENAIDSVLRKQSDFSEFYSDATDAITNTVLSLKSVADILDKIQGKYDALVSALNDMEEYGVLTASTFTSIMEDYSDLTDYLTQTENGYILNAEALTQYTSALVASYTAEAESATMTEKNKETAIQNLKNLQTALAMLAVSQSESQSASERRKEELEDEKDALNEQLDAYQELIDLRKELLQQYEDEVSYKKELAEKEKTVSQLQTKLAISHLDTSAAGRAKTRELSEELEEAQSELDDYTLEHAIEVVTNELESQYTEYETYINGEVDNIESLIDSLDNDVGDAAEAISASTASAAQSITEAIEKLELTSVVNVEGQPLAHGKEKWIESQAFSESSLDYGTKEYKVSHGGSGKSYHTGGIVGETAKLKSTETFAKLLKGEFVATPQMMHRFMNTTLPEIASSNSSNEFNAPLINIQCENVTQETLPKLESIVKEAVTQIKRQFEGGLGRAGYHKTVKQIT